ncbi:glycosyltransferase family 8 protein [Treponema bryantii]|uniref:glycosyltransferase family 8 protein n=1 Tax=Treponema bryantii TaxID=163 RepID=UPI0003B53F8E|nr:glycosyltransferase family 8 protein [Treponema bryantii]
MKKTKEIPVCFATDDNYVPFLAVAVSSLLDNASKENFYRIFVLITELKQDNIDKIKALETENSEITFISLAKEMDKIKDMFHLRDYYSKETYYRIFIPNLFPYYKKVLYLDCDITVLGDVAELYNHHIHGFYVGAAVEEVMQTYEVFGNYVEKADGIKRENYFNAGILLINCRRWRNKLIAERFVDLLNRYKFRVVQDEDYLNVLCKGHVRWINLGWNKTAYKNPAFDDKDLRLIHWKINWRPWKYKNVLYEEYFWKYAKMSGFYDKLIQMRDSRTQADFDKDEVLMQNLQQMAEEDANDPNNYNNTQGKTGSVWWFFDKIKRFARIRKLVTIKAYKRKRNHDRRKDN